VSIINDMKFSQSVVNRFRSDMVERLMKPGYLERFLPPSPPVSFWSRKWNRGAAAYNRVRDAWMVLTGKAEIREEED
jgi:hypothetical protein